MVILCRIAKVAIFLIVCWILGIKQLLGQSVPTVNPIANQTVCDNTATTAIHFSGTGTSYSWTNSNPVIGLAASGTGDIASFIASNTGNIPVTATITVTPSLSAGTRLAYIANNYSNDVSVINMATNTVIATIPVGANPEGVSVSPDGSSVYITNESSNDVSVINTATNIVTAIIPVGYGPFGAAVSTNNSQVYVANSDSYNVSVINTATNTVVATIPVDSRPWGVSVSPDGKSVYVTNRASNTVSVINTATNMVVATIQVGESPCGIQVSPDGTRVYVIDFVAAVSVINAVTSSSYNSVKQRFRPIWCIR
jgi:YVTN family beta-propeller protein